MKIGIVCSPTLGGSGAVATELATHLARRGHVVHLVSSRMPVGFGDFQENLAFHAAEASSYGLFEHPPRELALAAKLAEVARDEELDLLHVHYAIPYAVAAELARQLVGASAPRLVTTLHGTDVTLVAQDPSFAGLTRFALERSDGVTAVSEFLKRTTLEDLEVDCPIEVIPNFVDVADYCPTRAYKDVSAFAAPDERILLHASNFRPSRRTLDVVRVLERVAREAPVRLLMLGDGPERAAAQALARRLGVAERVSFLGQHQGGEEILAMADVFLLPSELESFGLAALQAMASGVPVIGTDAGGLPEVVRHTETGFLLPVGDVDGMAGRTLEILKDDERRVEMGQAGRRRAAALFDADRVVSQYERFYERVLSA